MSKNGEGNFPRIRNKSTMVQRALIAVAIMAGLETLTGTLRRVILSTHIFPAQGVEGAGILLAMCNILLVSRSTIQWIHPNSFMDRVLVGVVWYVGLLGFDLGLGILLTRSFPTWDQVGYLPVFGLVLVMAPFLGPGNK